MALKCRGLKMTKNREMARIDNGVCGGRPCRYSIEGQLIEACRGRTALEAE